MYINQRAYGFTCELIGLSETGSGKEMLMIETAHMVSRLDNTSVTMPWCSSWMNLAMMCANIRANPFASRQLLFGKGYSKMVIDTLFKYAEVYGDFEKMNTLLPVVAPTFSAAAKSWLTWGQPIAKENVKRGDIVVLTRQGGNHVAFLDEDKIGAVYTRLLGGNQGDKLCASNFLSANIISIRRSF